MDGETVSRERGEFAANWRLILCCLLGIPVPIFALYALGQILDPLEQEFGWSRSEASAGLSISLVLGFLATPLVGRLVDSVNARWLVLPGIVLTGIALASLSLTTGNSAMWIGLWSFHAVVGALIGPPVWLAVVSQAFVRMRSLAISIALCGTSLASAFSPPLTQFLVDEYGWRMALQMLSLIVALPALVCALLFFFDHRPLDGKSRQAAQDVGATRPKLGAILLSATFLRMAIVVFVLFTAASAYIIHLSPIIVDKGFTAVTAATIAGSAGLVALGGKLCVGVVFDRLNPSMVATGLFVVFAAACAIMAQDNLGLWAVTVASGLLGICGGGLYVAVACLTTRLFHASVFGTVYGILISLTALGGALGPFLASVLYDHSGSYSLSFWVGAAVALGSAVLLPPVRPLAETA